MSNVRAMKRMLLTVAATAVALEATFLFRGYLLREYAGQTADTRFPPWNLLEAGFVFFLTIGLLAVVSRLTSSPRFVVGSAALYIVCISWPGATVSHQHGSLTFLLTTYVAVYLTEAAAVFALALVLLRHRIRHARA